MVALSLTLAIGASACGVQENQFQGIDNPDTEIFYIPDDCDVAVAVEDMSGQQQQDAHEESVVIADNYSQPKTAADVEEVSIANLHETLKEISETEMIFQDHYESTGITLEIFSDGLLNVSANELREIFYLPLELKDDYKHPLLRNTTTCYDEAVHQRGSLQDKRLRIFIFSEPQICFKSLGLVQRNEVDQCYKGLSLPRVNLRNSIVNLDTGHNIYIATGARNQEAADADLSKILLHEILHFYDWVHGAPISLKQNEQFAYYTTNEILQVLRKSQRELPQPINFG